MLLESPWGLALCGLLVGSVMGYIARANHFCTLAALERHWFAADSTGVRAWALAAVVAMLVTQVLAMVGLADVDASFYITEPLPVAGGILGGIMFGFGMALVGTCGFGAIVRLGGGNMRALVVLVGLGLSAIAAQRGLTGHFRENILDLGAIDLNAAGGQSLPLLIGGIAGTDLVLPVFLLAGVGVIVWLLRDPGFRADRGKVLAGIAIGLCISAGWVVTTWYSRTLFDPVQLEAGSFVSPVGDAIRQIITVTGELPDYGVGLVAGVFVGAAIAAWRADDVRWEACDDARELSRHLAGAFLMGTGGIFAMGCTIGQGVTAVSALAISAPIVMVSILFGARLGLGYLIEGDAFGFLKSGLGTHPAE